jgi:alanine dehydrogenase
MEACREDESLFLGLNVINGKVVYPGVAEAFGIDLADARSYL